MQPGGSSDRPETDAKAAAVLCVLEGVIELTLNGVPHVMEPGGSAFFSAPVRWPLHNRRESNAKFHWIRKACAPVEGIGMPGALVTSDHDVAPVVTPDTNGVRATSRFVDPGDLRPDIYVTILFTLAE